MWKSAGQVATAYKIGRAESGAALALLNEVEDEIYVRLTGLVKYLGQQFSLTNNCPFAYYMSDACRSALPPTTFPLRDSPLKISNL